MAEKRPTRKRKSVANAQVSLFVKTESKSLGEKDKLKVIGFDCGMSYLCSHKE